MALSKIFVAPKNGQGGVKKSKKNFSQKKYSKDGKNKFWDLWDHNFIFRKSSDMFRTLTLPPPTLPPYPLRTVPRLRPIYTICFWTNHPKVGRGIYRFSVFLSKIFISHF